MFEKEDLRSGLLLSVDSVYTLNQPTITMKTDDTDGDDGDDGGDGDQD